MANLIYKTDFENVSSWQSKTGSIWYLNMPNLLPNPPTIDNIFALEGGAFAWIEGLEANLLPSGALPHSGTRCLGLATPAGVVSGVKRVEFNINNIQNVLNTNELYMSCWCYWGNDFMTLNIGENDWAIFQTAVTTGQAGNFMPLIEIGCERPYPYGATDFEIRVLDRGENNAYLYYRNNKKFDLASYRTGWHHTAIYVKRDKSIVAGGTQQGVVQYWIDGVLTLNAQPTEFGGFTTQHSTVPEWYIAPGKLYMNGTMTNPMHLWVDDLEIWDGIPALKPTLAVKSTPQGIPVTITKVS